MSHRYPLALAGVCVNRIGKKQTLCPPDASTDTLCRAVHSRKNALFASNDGGARHWAIALTLIQSAKLNGVDPMAYLTDVLERIVSGRTKAHELQTLLPWNWKAAISGTTAAQAA